MRNYNTDYLHGQDGIHCVEIVIPESFISAHDLYRTLSLYSLQNEPLADNPSGECHQSFHFMLYDWLRTLRLLLDDKRIQYTVIKRFSLADIHGDGKDTSSDTHLITSGAFMIYETAM